MQEEVDALNAKLAQNSKTEVKTIIKDDQETKGLLLAEFQEKIRSMEEANTAEKAEY